MAGRGQVISLQVGSYANFVGSHFWNIQDEVAGQGMFSSEIDHAILHSVRETRKGVEEWNPRVVVVDLKGCLGPLSLSSSPPSSSQAASNPPVITTWAGSAAVHREQTIARNKFLRSLEEEGDEDVSGKTSTEDLAEREERHGRWGRETQASRGHAGGGSRREKDRGDGEKWGELEEEEEDGGGEEAGAQGEGKGHREGKEAEREEEEGEDRERVKELDEGVEYWAEFLKAQIHPKSVVETPLRWWGGDRGGGMFGERGEMGGREVEEEIEDRIRFFAEDCDHLQGFNITTHDFDSFAEIAASACHLLSDDYPKQTRLIFPLHPPPSHSPPPLGPLPLSCLPQLLSSAISFASLLPLSHLTLPLGFNSGKDACPLLLPSDSKPFHSAALFASALHSATLPFRLSTPSSQSDGSIETLGSMSMHGFASIFQRAPRGSLGFVHMAMPGPSVIEEARGRQRKLGRTFLGSFSPCIGGFDLPSNHGATSEAHRPMNGVDSCLFTLQGVSRQDSSEVPPRLASSLLQESLRLSSDSREPIRGLHVAATQQPLAIPLPFPFIFSPNLSKRGQVELQKSTASNHGPVGGDKVESVPIISRVATGKANAEILKLHEANLGYLFGRRGFQARAKFEDFGLEREEASELMETLTNTRQAYNPLEDEMDV